MKEITVWGCVFCSMVSRRKGSVVRHEKTFCRKNPARHTCGKCNHMAYEAGYSEPIDHGQTHYESPSWYCELKEKDLNDQNLNADTDCDGYEPQLLTPPQIMQ